MRAKRISYPGAHYHIILRGNNKDPLFYDDKDREKFLQILLKYRNKFNLNIFAYTLMTNHIHLFLETKKPNISSAMKMINWSYAIYFNRKYNKTGHLFCSRFTAKLINNEKYFYTVLKYIHLNPVKANLVKNPENYKWSSHLDYIKGGSEIINNIWEILDLFSKDNKKAIDSYKEFMEIKFNDKEYEILNRVRNEILSDKLNKLYGKGKEKDPGRIISSIIKINSLNKKIYMKVKEKII